MYMLCFVVMNLSFFWTFTFLDVAANMAEEKLQQFLKEHAQRDTEAYANNYKAFRPGISPQESTQVYNGWTSYDQVSSGLTYQGPPSSAYG